MEKIQQQELVRPTSSNGSNFFTCEICVQIVPVNKQFKSMEMSGCLHPYCTDCVAKYIQEKVIEHNRSEIKCANTDCNIMLDASLCQSALLSKSSKILLDSSKGGLGYGRSYCPFRDCSELILNECVRISPSTNNNSNSTSRTTKSNCPNCKKLFCFHCVEPLFATTVEGRRNVYVATTLSALYSLFCWRYLQSPLLSGFFIIYTKKKES
ncbi:hypothetical protein MKW98_011306 [Papaver atlanticum]|uniref:Uncharacterized protein n=1 Tax=Papaver atlanticum TaxID=357466 RepID=A0AAD4SW43_9MAGN|nr:hypothetical protein MKW98_011306 [Papaver atlanticum]